jgi:glycosyltransferase involved in cell wall biosynthesis
LRRERQRWKLRAVTIRVLHVDTERGWRGGERQALWLARELARRGHGSMVAARTGEALFDRARAAALETIASSPRSELDVVAAWSLRRLIRARAIDIVHAHTAHAVALCALATLHTDAKLVVARRVDFRLRNNAGTRWKYGRANAIVAVSEAVARVLVQSGVERHRIAVVPDGVDVHRVVEPIARDTLEALGIRPAARLVVQVAQLVGHKDPLNFVAAMAHVNAAVPDAQGLLVGDGPLRGAVEVEIRRLGLEAVVRLAGYRTDADSILAAADVACLSSKEEGMGSVLLDALAFGRPIAATSAGGIPEIVADGESGLLAPPAQPDALGENIARLLTDRMLADRLRTNALASVAAFSVERMTDRTMAVYERVLGSR